MDKRLSTFPQRADKRTFFSDISLENETLLSQHHAASGMQKFREASQAAHNSKFNYYSAELFNFFEDAVRKIGLYLQERSDMSHRPVFSKEEPEQLTDGMIWISED